MEQVLEMLPIVGKGYAGVFIVMGIIMLAVMILNKWENA